MQGKWYSVVDEVGSSALQLVQCVEMQEMGSSHEQLAVADYTFPHLEVARDWGQLVKSQMSVEASSFVQS